MSELTSFLTFFIALCAISVHTAPAMDSTAATNNDENGKLKENVSMMNKTANEKSLSMAGKSMRPFVAVPFYTPPQMSLKLQRAPPKYDSYGMNAPYVHRPTAAYTGYQPAQIYPSFAPLAPVPHRQIPPIFNYQHQPLVPSTYNYAPYAANTYASYGYRSAPEEEKVQPVLVDPPVQPSVQYETRYIMKPQEYLFEEPQQYLTNEYTVSNMDSTSSSQMQPREMYVMGPQNRYDLMDDKISVNYMSPIAEPSDSIFWEMKRPYGYIARPQTYPEMESHQLSYRFTEPSDNYSAQPKPLLIDSTNWALPGGENVPSMFYM